MPSLLTYYIDGPYDEAETWLRSIKGIGKWSASFLLLRALGRTERMLLNLKPFLAIVPRLYDPHVTMEQLAQRYGHEFGYWCIYLRTAE